MKNIFTKNLLVLLIYLTHLTVHARPSSVIIPRSQSVNAARELVGWQQFINQCCTDSYYGALSFTGEYTQSFRGAQLMSYLFGNDVKICNRNMAVNNQVGCCLSGCTDTAQLRIQGSCVENRTANAWLADYFGLSPLFDSTVFFQPKIQNSLVDIDFYLGFNENFYFRIHAPIVWTKWNLQFSEIVNNNPTTPTFQAGYMAASQVNITRNSFLSAMDGTYTFGDVKEPLAFGKFCGTPVPRTDCCSKNNKGGFTHAGLSEIECALGYNFVNEENYHFGLQLRGSAPTGNRPTVECLFQPIVGNGKFWTFGGGITAHGVLWQDCTCADRALSFYIDANITHLFKSCQPRSFDLIGKPNSRYMLVEEFAPSTASTVVGANFLAGAPAILFSNATAATAAGSTAPARQYASNLSYLINHTTFDVGVSYDVQGDMAFKFSYTHNNWELDLGYEFWARGRENICISNFFPENTYALKGDAFIYGFTAANSATLGANAGNPLRLSATESLATIHSGTNVINGDCSAASRLNPNIDSPQFAMFGLNGNPPAAVTDQLVLSPGDNAGATQQRTSSTPIFIKAIDLETFVNTRALTHKIFGNISHAWNCSCISPFLGIGFEVEFATQDNNTCPTTACCASEAACGSDNAAVSQWGVWVKTGIGF